MKKFNAIMACDIKGGIAKNGSLPWEKNKTDFQHFKKITSGHTVVMGSGTWLDPIFPKPLPNRKNIVLSSRDIQGADVVLNGEGYMEYLQNLPEDIFIIGGYHVLQSTFDFINTFYLTIFQDDYKCDLHIPLEIFNSWTVEDKNEIDNLVFLKYKR